MALPIMAAAALCTPSLHAQSATLLFGNPQVYPAVQQRGVVTQTSVKQTATTSTVTYTATAPAGQTNQYLDLGRINFEIVGTYDGPITVTYSGGISVEGHGNQNNIGNNGFKGGNLNADSSPQTITDYFGPGTAYLNFTFSSVLAGFPQQATITITFPIGNASGARAPYVNNFYGTSASYPINFRPSSGNWFGLYDDVPSVQQWGGPADVPVPGDYDGDGVSDFAIWRPSTGTWYIILSSTGQGEAIPWGAAGDIPVAATDFDGDGKSDVTIFRPSEGNWYSILSSTGQAQVIQWGGPGDIPIANADFDGDGKSDIAIFRPSEGNWYTILSGTGQGKVTQWGGAGDIPVAGDFDGDGKTDIAIWRPTEGNWYIVYSGSGAPAIEQVGAPGDIPVRADFDGDGKADYVVYRPSTQQWLASSSSRPGQVLPLQWGDATDIPIGSVLTSAPTP